MKPAERQPRRQPPRFPCSLELRGRKLASLGVCPDKSKDPIRGQTQDISQGGVCLLSNRSIPASSLVRCEFEIPGNCVAIPTLMQVAWTQRTATGMYKIGLQFLL
jgi:c-di-GMP-binding flagellar brake protein YcgR